MSRREGETEEERQARKLAKKEKKERKEKRKADQVAAGPSTSTSTTAAAAAAAAAEDKPAKKRKVATAAADSSAVASFLAENSISFDPADAAASFPPALDFAQLDVDDGLRSGLSRFSKPTPIQACSFPVMMGGRDVVGIAETGSGKTVAFGTPAIQHVLSLTSTKPGKSSKKSPVSVLVVAPTRELAMQTHDNLSQLAASIDEINSVCIYGGASKDEQKALLRKGPRIVVGTPGRILDLANEGALKLGSVSWLVLDEADRMLDKGFENDIREIIAKTLPTPASPLAPVRRQGADYAPTHRTTCMFSATWPLSVRRLASDFMHAAVRITVGSEELTANSRVEQAVLVLTNPRDKEALLPKTLRQHGFGKANAKGGAARDKCLVFALYKKEAVRLEQALQRQGFEVRCIQGDMSQDRRTKALDDFKTGRAEILVATDVAARGLDIPKVELVLNNTMGLTIEDYIHRIGRTGRAGRTGKSVTFFTEEDKAHAGELMRILRESNQKIPEGIDQWGSAIKKKQHGSYGSHYREDIQGTSKKIVFD